MLTHPSCAALFRLAVVRWIAPSVSATCQPSDGTRSFGGSWVTALYEQVSCHPGMAGSFALLVLGTGSEDSPGHDRGVRTNAESPGKIRGAASYATHA